VAQGAATFVKIIVRAPNWLGDLVMSFPFFAALGDAYPDAEIVTIAKPAFLPLLDLLPFPTTRVPFQKQDSPGLGGIINFSRSLPVVRNAEVYFCLPPSLSSAVLGLVIWARHRVGYRSDARSILLTHKAKTPEAVHRRQAYCQLLSVYTGQSSVAVNDPPLPELPPLPAAGESGQYLVLNPNAQASSRRLPLQQWRVLLQSLGSQRYVLIGTGEDKERNIRLQDCLPPGSECRDLAGSTSIMELARLLAHSRGVISNDSGPAHLAAYVGARLVVFIGAADPVETEQIGRDSRVLVLTAGVDCAPCVKNECPLTTLACLTGLDFTRREQEIRDFFGL
jgi:ADP-heptose:LPS heptosyltransferase